MKYSKQSIISKSKMGSIYSVVLPIILLFFSLQGLSQDRQLSFQEVTGANGITLGKVNAIIQDKNGFIWFSDQTNRSIVRYDGNYMKRISFEEGNPNSLGGYYPECFATDPSGILWIGYYGQGVDRYDPSSQTFTHYKHDPTDPSSLVNNTVSAILVDRTGAVWIGTDGGLDHLDVKSGTFTHYKHNPNDPTSLSDNLARTLYEDSHGTLWIGTGIAFESGKTGGLNRFNRDSGTFTRYLHDPDDPESLVDNKVRAVLEDSHGNFWVGTRGDGLHRMDRKTGKFERLSFDASNPHKLSRPPVKGMEDHITFLVEDAEKQIWIGTLNNGVVRFDPQTGKKVHFGNPEDNSGAYVDNASWAAHSTPEGIVWLATQYDQMLLKIDLNNVYFNMTPIDYFIFSFLEESDSIYWYGTNAGLIRENKITGKRIQYTHIPGDPGTLSSNNVYDLTMDEEGIIWIETDKGMDRFNSKSKTFKNVLSGKTNDSFSINAMVPDQLGNIWVGTNGEGIYRYNKNTAAFSRGEFGFDGYYRVQDLLIDYERNLWSATMNGLSRHNLESDDGDFYLNGLLISRLFIDSDSILWACTDNGLYRYVISDNVFKAYSIEADVSDMNEDNQHNLWVVSSIGLTRINPGTGQISNFGAENGIYGEIMRHSIIYKTSQGRMLIGSNYKGYFEFSPEKVASFNDSSKILFTEFSVIDNLLAPDPKGPLKESIFSAKECYLDHNQDIFSIGITEINFRSTGNNELSYMLENYDYGWRKTYAGDQVTYFKVPPGKYTFIVRASGSSTGELNEKRMAIYIAPPWWKTGWAYGFYVVLLISGVMVVDRYQRKRVIEKERSRAREKELIQAREIEKAYTELKATQFQLVQSEKMASLGELTAGIAHEIQNPLNFVNNFSEVSKELIGEMNDELKKGDIEEAKLIANDIDKNLEKIYHHGQRASDIVKGMLQHSRTSAGEKEPTDLNSMADEFLRLSYHGLRAKNHDFNADFKTDFDESLPKVNVVPQDIGRVLLNLINNAFYSVSEASAKETAVSNYKPLVTVITKKLEGKLEIRVMDNGPGIPSEIKDKIFQPFFTTKPTGQGTGLGLSLSYDIVKAHGGEISVESEEGKGTAFIIQIPVA